MAQLRWKNLPPDKRAEIADAMRSHSAFYVAHTFGIAVRTVSNWKRYADASVPFTEVRGRGWNGVRTQDEVEDEYAEDDKRDDRTLAVYRELREHEGTTWKEIADATGYSMSAIVADLKYLASGKMAKCKRGKWYGVPAGDPWEGKVRGQYRRKLLYGKRHAMAG